MKKRKLIFGTLLFLVGIFLLIDLKFSMTGNVIFFSQAFPNLVFILGTILFFGGLLLMLAGTLEGEVQKKYDGVIILCRNFKGYPFKHKPVRGKLDITLAGKMNCVVAAEMYKRGITNKIIFGSGKTCGQEWPSETEGFRNYLSKRYPEIPEKDLLMQEDNLDTYEELDKDIELARSNGLMRLALITINTQLPRCKRYLEKKREHLDYISAEEEFKKLGPHYKILAEKYAESPSVKYYETLKEFILRGLQSIGITGKFTKPLAKIVRK